MKVILTEIRRGRLIDDPSDPVSREVGIDEFPGLSELEYQCLVYLLQEKSV